jgi:Uma2 family endonuclease
MSDEEFLAFCRANPELRIEQTAEGELIVMPPAGSETGGQNFTLAGLFFIWVRADGTGKGFDSSAGFTLPNGAKRSPDVSWVRRDRWEALSPEERKRFAPICPDFVVELRSPTDDLEELQAKLEEYLENGAQLGWIIDPLEQQVHIYRPGEPVLCLEDPATVAGDPLLPGFSLGLKEVWDA